MDRTVDALLSLPANTVQSLLSLNKFCGLLYPLALVTLFLTLSAFHSDLRLS